MNDNRNDHTGSRRRTGVRLVAGAAAVAAVAMVATTAPVVAKDLVTTSDLAKGAVTSPKIAKKAVKPRHLAQGAVKTAKIKNGAVTSAKLAPGSVSRNHVTADLQPLWAVVWGGPSIARGKGAVAVQFEGVNTQYRVTFDRDVSQCSYTASLSGRDSGDPEQIGMVNVSAFAGDPNAVLVRTRDHDGVAASRGFTVQVLC